MHVATNAIQRNLQKVNDLTHDVALMRNHLSNITETMKQLLPSVEVNYKPMTTANWKRLLTQANNRCKYTTPDKQPVPLDQLDQVAQRLAAENEQGMPYFKNKYNQWQIGELESDLFGGEYANAYIAPRLLNQGLVTANTEYMVKTATGKYQVQIKVNHKKLYLGQYRTKEIASDVYKAAKQEYLCLLAEHYKDFLSESVTEQLQKYIVQ